MPRSIIRTAVVALACAAPALGQPPALEEFPDTRFREAAVTEYDDGALQVVAAYAHAQVRHESRWLFIQVGFGTMESMSVRPDDIALVRPDGVEVPVAAVRDHRRDIGGVRQLQNEVNNFHHRVVDYIRQPAGFRFFFGMHPGGGVPDRIARIGRQRHAWGDLYFVAPDGTWAAGTHALVVRDGDDVIARLPVVLE